jgi:HEAT repeat protein
MDKTLQQLITLVETGSIEQRCAGLLVMAALKVQNSEIIKSLATALNHTNPLLKDYALRYFEAVQTKSRVPLLLRFLDDPDKETQERVIRLLITAGPPAVDALLKQAGNGSRVWQLSAARVLCAVGGKTAAKGLLQLLTSGTDEFNKVVCDLMTPAIRQMDSKEQEMLHGEIDAFIPKLDIKQHRPAVVSALRLLGQLGLPQARRWLFKFVAAEHHLSLRSHALVALLHCPDSKA